MKTNIKTITITIPSQEVLNLINHTPALRNLSKLSLKIGENIENVNYFQYSQLKRMYSLIGCTINEN